MATSIGCFTALFGRKPASAEPRAQGRAPVSIPDEDRAGAERTGPSGRSRPGAAQEGAHRPRTALPGPSHCAETEGRLSGLPRDILENIASRLDPYESLSLARTDTEAYGKLRNTPELKTLRLDGLIQGVTTLDGFRGLLKQEGAARPDDGVLGMNEPMRTDLVASLMGRIRHLPEAQMQQAFDLGHEVIRRLPEGRRSLALQSLLREIPSLPATARRAEFTRCREAVRQLADGAGAMNVLQQQVWSIPMDPGALDKLRDAAPR
jgi:hypothetical protein